MSRRLLAVCTIAILAISHSLAMAQGGSSAFRSSGMGSSGFGSSGFGGGGMGGSSLGSSGLGLSNPFGSGSSGMGSGGLGNAGFGSSRFGSSGFGLAGFGGSQSGSSGNGYGGGQNFVGRDASDMQGVFGQTSNSANQFFSNMNRNMRQQSSRQHKSTQSTVQNPAQPMRVEVKVAFKPPQQTSSQLAETIRTRLAKTLAAHQMSPANFTLEGDTAVIRGVAASEDERAVIGQLLALQPGVNQVRNEMTVGTPSSAAVPASGS